MSAPEEFGGQNLPTVLTIAAFEMWSAANTAFGLVPVLSQSAIELMLEHADPVLKHTYLHKMVSGEWTTTMNLTEPQAGSDLSLLRTKAVKEGDYYRISGQKIYISGGDHDPATTSSTWFWRDCPMHHPVIEASHFSRSQIPGEEERGIRRQKRPEAHLFRD